MFHKLILAAGTAAAIGLGFGAASTPASAQGYGFHGGGPGYHSGYRPHYPRYGYGRPRYSVRPIYMPRYFAPRRATTCVPVRVRFWDGYTWRVRWREDCRRY